MTSKLCVGIIMDGNRRFAKREGLSVAEGHKRGFAALENLLNDFPMLKKEHGIYEYVFYAFSTENWKRSNEEVQNLMDLFRYGLSRIEEALQKEERPQIRFIGNRDRFDDDIQKEIARIEEETKDGEGVVAIALSYGGRDEIVRAVQKAEDLTEEGIQNALDTHGMQDPDLIIRTGGEQRLSNFLLWQAAYSEFFFIEKFWPEFTSDDLIKCVVEYNTRERRKGS